MPDTTTTEPFTIPQRGVDVLMLAACCAHAAVMIHTCQPLVDAPNSTYDERLLAHEVLFDARVLLADARETLVDMGANVREATSAILGLSELGGAL
jgi:hypothetical protein